MSVRDSTVMTCQPSVVPPHCHRVPALSLAQVSPTLLWAHTPLAKDGQIS